MRRKCFIALSLLPLVLSFSVVDRQHEAPQHVHHQISLDKALQEAKNMKVYEGTMIMHALLGYSNDKIVVQIRCVLIVLSELQWD